MAGLAQSILKWRITKVLSGCVSDFMARFKVLAGGKDVNLEQVRVGMAWHYKVHFEPIFDSTIFEGDEHEYVDGEIWAHGYMTAIEMHRDT